MLKINPGSAGVTAIRPEALQDQRIVMTPLRSQEFCCGRAPRGLLGTKGKLVNGEHPATDEACQGSMTAMASGARFLSMSCYIFTTTGSNRPLWPKQRSFTAACLDGTREASDQSVRIASALHGGDDHGQEEIQV
uniref:Uncharacterized protein n=1 Tax=Coccidioides posadasii RMSCC 3488 TaxID=454284 RepID=A0A0J6FLU5_COCPO|nr:hypothetical protein CPAG_06162 [Coccidioides posadasii RMSCC 3488]